MAAGNGAQRSDRIEHGIIRSLRFAPFTVAIVTCQLVSGLPKDGRIEKKVEMNEPPSLQENLCEPTL